MGRDGNVSYGLLAASSTGRGRYFRWEHRNRTHMDLRIEDGSCPATGVCRRRLADQFPGGTIFQRPLVLPKPSFSPL